MSSFKFSFLESCENLKLKPNDRVLNEIDESLSSNIFNLSTVELDDTTCKALGLALTKDVFIQELDLSNCMLNDNGLLSILSGLEKNRFLRTLILKGNNIRSLGTEAIGKFLRHNNSLENLDLEWNGIGIFPEKFAYFCEGLSINTSLKLLDLKNNQLNLICAQSLSTALYRNSSLLRLDLRWNAIGLLGGRELLKALSKNKSILKLEVSGNDIPLEIQESIESLASAAAKQYLMKNDNLERSKFYSLKLQEIELEQNRQLKLLMDQLDKKDKDMMSSQRWNSIKVIELQEALSEKEDIIDSLRKKCKDMEREINVTVEMKNGLALELNEVEIKFKEWKRDFQLLLDRERQEKEKMERKLLEEMGSLKEENTFMKQQVQDYKTKNANLDDQILKLKTSQTKLEKISKLEEASFQEQLTLFKEKHQEEIAEVNEMRKNEISRIRKDFSEVEKNLKEKITFLEKRKCDLEKLVSDKEHKILANQTETEVKIEELKKKMKDDEERMMVQMEEKISILESDNKKQEEQLKDQLQTMHNIRKMLTENDLLLAKEAHRTEQLQKSLEAKEAEIETAVAKVKLEVKEQLEELEQVKKLLTDSNAEKASLEEKIEDMQKQHKEDIEQKEESVNALKDRANQLKRKIKDMLKNGNERIKDLELALKSYVDSAKTEVDIELSD